MRDRNFVKSNRQEKQKRDKREMDAGGQLSCSNSCYVDA